MRSRFWVDVGVVVILIIGVSAFAMMNRHDSPATTARKTPTPEASAVNQMSMALYGSPSSERSLTPSIATVKMASKARMTKHSNGLEYEDLNIGEGKAIEVGETVCINYTGWFPNGKKFDSNKDHGGAPFCFVEGQHRLIPGLEQGVMTMRVGGKRRIIIPPSLAYGHRGMPPVIPENATLVFEVEVLQGDENK
jgi:FKBP-type peptidyl-prolyl cis-trans isomerase